MSRDNCNCEMIRERLIDLVYGELADADERRSVEEHVAACDECSAELTKLRAARSALATYRVGEPKGGTGFQPVVRPYRRFFLGAAGIAAMVLVAVGVWMLQEETTRRVIAADGPVEIKRVNVSLTILSEPENWPVYPRWGQRRTQWSDNNVNWVSTNKSIAGLVVYNSNPHADAQGNAFDVPSRRRTGGWGGLALVRDQRVVRNLPKGTTAVRFTDVPSGILPDTVRLRSLDAPTGLSILEQNYQYDLASASAVLKRYVDKKITVLFKTGEAASGTLLSFDKNTLVIQPTVLPHMRVARSPGPRNIAREQVKAITFEKLPAGLLSKPTLLWQLRNSAVGKQRFEVAYLTGGITWRADYVLKLRPAKKPALRQAQGKQSEIIDFADIVGYATITNNSGVTYENAQLKLLAGDVNLIRPEVEMYGWNWDESNRPRSGAKVSALGFKEKSFFEYHLYTLSRPTTIRSAETKQIELVSGNGLKMKRGYVYDENVHKSAVRVVSEFKNSKANGLGKPLPKGVIRLYAPDPTGVQTYAAKTTIDHTPKNEKVRLPWGFAFDIVCSARQIDYRRRGSDHYHKWRCELRNHKDYDVTITIIMRRPKATYWAKCTKDGKDYPWHIREVGVWEIEVPVKADSAETVTFEYRHNPKAGGGLKSPWDEKKR